uniref:Uncharacterized protein n=1 Tax=Myotis myotis TaxID=51298 RepID=A0A7J7U596_MYOMY|nr:hypothetical protein mMyoMyo1_008848 [Myotis myotis]
MPVSVSIKGAYQKALIRKAGLISSPGGGLERNGDVAFGQAGREREASSDQGCHRGYGSDPASLSAGLSPQPPRQSVLGRAPTPPQSVLGHQGNSALTSGLVEPWVVRTLALYYIDYLLIIVFYSIQTTNCKPTFAPPCINMETVQSTNTHSPIHRGTPFQTGI